MREKLAELHAISTPLKYLSTYIIDGDKKLTQEGGIDSFVTMYAVGGELIVIVVEPPDYLTTSRPYQMAMLGKLRTTSE